MSNMKLIFLTREKIADSLSQTHVQFNGLFAGATPVVWSRKHREFRRLETKEQCFDWLSEFPTAGSITEVDTDFDAPVRHINAP